LPLEVLVEEVAEVTDALGVVVGKGGHRQLLAVIGYARGAKIRRRCSCAVPATVGASWLPPAEAATAGTAPSGFVKRRNLACSRCSYSARMRASASATARWTAASTSTRGCSAEAGARP